MIDSPVGQSNYPHLGNTILFCSSQQLPHLRLRPSKGLWSRHFALQGPSTSLACCFQNYRETWTLTKTTAANIDCATLTTHIFSFFLKFKWPRPPHTPPQFVTISTLSSVTGGFDGKIVLSTLLTSQ